MNFDLPIFCVDCETGGEFDGSPQLIELAGLRIEPDNSVSFYETLVKNTHPVDPQSSAIHQLRDEDLINATPANEAVAKLIELGEDAIWVLFNAPYDLQVIANHVGSSAEMAKGIIALDAHRLAVHVWPDASSHKLHVLYHQLRLPREQRIHRAGPDVKITCQVLRRLAAASSCWETARLLDVSIRPLPVPAMKFGKHAGQPLSEIPSDYFDWWLNKRAPTANENYDLNYAVASELQSRGEPVDAEQYGTIATAAAARWTTPFATALTGNQL